MYELILHHYDFSPFSEKIRLIFGLKALAWRSVTIHSVMPKPDLIALTGGYRHTPVQIGADIFCDTRLIARELERRYPQAPLLDEQPSKTWRETAGRFCSAMRPGSPISRSTTRSGSSPRCRSTARPRSSPAPPPKRG